MGKVNLQRGRKEYGVREEGKEGWKEGSKKKDEEEAEKRWCGQSISASDENLNRDVLCFIKGNLQFTLTEKRIWDFSSLSEQITLQDVHSQKNGYWCLCFIKRVNNSAGCFIHKMTNFISNPYVFFDPCSNSNGCSRDKKYIRKENNRRQVIYTYPFQGKPNLV